MFSTSAAIPKECMKGRALVGACSWRELLIVNLDIFCTPIELKESNKDQGEESAKHGIGVLEQYVKSKAKGICTALKHKLMYTDYKKTILSNKEKRVQQSATRLRCVP